MLIVSLGAVNVQTDRTGTRQPARMVLDRQTDRLVLDRLVQTDRQTDWCKTDRQASSPVPQEKRPAEGPFT